MASNSEGSKFSSEAELITHSLTQELRSPLLLSNPQNKGYVDDGVETLDYTEDPASKAFYELLVDVDPLETLTPSAPTIPQIVTYINNIPAGISLDQIYGTSVKCAMLSTSDHVDSYPRHNQHLETETPFVAPNRDDSSGQRGVGEISSFLAALTPKHRLHALNMKMGSITVDQDGTYLADPSLGDGLTDLIRTELKHALGIEFIQYLDHYGVQKALAMATAQRPVADGQQRDSSSLPLEQHGGSAPVIDISIPNPPVPSEDDDNDDGSTPTTGSSPSSGLPASLSLVAYDKEVTKQLDKQNQIPASYREPMFEPIPPPIVSTQQANTTAVAVSSSSPYFNEFDKSDKLYLVGVDAPMEKTTYANIEFLTSFWPQLTRFIICFLAACSIATLAYFTEYFIGILNNFLYWVMTTLLQQQGGVIGYSPGLAWLWPSLAIVSSTMVVVAYLTFGVTLVYWGGLYAVRGSGLPPLNAYLDGTYDPSIPLFGTKIMVSKILSVSLALGGMVKGGLQGPLIHVGAMIARMVSKQTLKILRTKPCIFVMKNLFCCCHDESTIFCPNRSEKQSRYHGRGPQAQHDGYMRQYNTQETRIDMMMSSDDEQSYNGHSALPAASVARQRTQSNVQFPIVNDDEDDDDDDSLRLMQEHMRGKLSLNSSSPNAPDMPALMKDLEAQMESRKTRADEKERRQLARQQQYVIGSDDDCSREIENRLSIFAYRSNFDVTDDYYPQDRHTSSSQTDQYTSPYTAYNSTTSTSPTPTPTTTSPTPASAPGSPSGDVIKYKFRLASRAKTSQVSGGAKNNDYTEHKKLTFAQRIEVLCRSLSGPGDEHDFLACGAASGFACAFNAPLAGMIMVQSMIKQAVSFQLTLRLFFTTLVSVIVTNLFDSDQSILPDRGFVDLDIPPADPMPVTELFLTALLGIIGGLLGVFVIKVNLILQNYRLKLYRDRFIPNLQYTILLSLFVIIPGIVLSLSTSCSPISEDSFPVCIDHPTRCIRLACPEGQFSQFGTFFFNAPSQFLRVVWDRSNNDNNEFNIIYIVTYLLIYLFLASASFMAAFPGGFFLPSILLGGMYGRVLARLVNHFAAPYTLNIGVYATLGSVALLSAINRLTTPLVVMMVEFTSDVQFLTPIMIVIICSKFVADFLIGGLEQEVGKIQVRSQYVALGEAPHPAIAHITAKDILSINTNLLGYPSACQNDESYSGQSDLAVIGEIDTVHRINAILATTTHSSFPVVSVLPGHLMKCEHLHKGAAALAEDYNTRHNKQPHSSKDLEHYFGCKCGVDKLQTGRLIGLITRRSLQHIVEKSVDYTRATKVSLHDHHHHITDPRSLSRSSSNRKKDQFGNTINATETHPDTLSDDVRSHGRPADKQHISHSIHHDTHTDDLDFHPTCTCLRCMTYRWPLIRFHNPILALLHHPLSKKSILPIIASIYYQLTRSFQHHTFYNRFTDPQHRKLLVLVQQRELIALTLNIITNTIRLPLLPLHIRSALSRLTSKHSMRANPTIGIKGSNNVGLSINDDAPVAGGINGIINQRDEFNDDPAFVSPLVKLISWLEERSMVRTSLNSQPIKRVDLSSDSSSSVGITAASLCVSLVNTLPLTDFGIYVVSETTPGHRVWRQFRTVGMAKVVVVNELNVPIGVITRKDVVRADKHCAAQMTLFKQKLNEHSN